MSPASSSSSSKSEARTDRTVVKQEEWTAALAVALKEHAAKNPSKELEDASEEHASVSQAPAAALATVIKSAGMSMK